VRNGTGIVTMMSRNEVENKKGKGFQILTKSQQ